MCIRKTAFYFEATNRDEQWRQTDYTLLTLARKKAVLRVGLAIISLALRKRFGDRNSEPIIGTQEKILGAFAID